MGKVARRQYRVVNMKNRLRTCVNGFSFFLTLILALLTTVGYNPYMSTSWSTSRQLKFGSVFVLAVLIIVGTPIYFIFFNKAPTCFDNKQNQDEAGIDCGGLCQRACVQEVIAEPIVLWARAFPVGSGTYNLVAYVQNANVNYIADPIEYSFRVYDKDNILIGLRDGKVGVPPVKSYPIFEQGFDAGERIPAKVLFEFHTKVDWKKYSAVKPEVKISEPSVSGTSTSPRITANLINTTLNRYENIEVVTIVYGKGDNAIATSRTFVDVLGSRSQVPMVFTWPNPWTEEPTKIEIIPKLKF